MPPWFARILRQYDRIAIVGGPRTGKTTLAAMADRPTFGTDVLVNREWADVPAALFREVRALGPRFVVEGVQVARALRKGLGVDAVIYLTRQIPPVNGGQRSMAKAVGTVFREWERTRTAGVPIIVPGAWHLGVSA